MTTGELLVAAGLLGLVLLFLRQCALSTPPFFAGVLCGGWCALTFIVGHGGGSPAWLPGGGGGWQGFDPSPLFCARAVPPRRPATVLFPLPDVFEPAEVVRPWSVLVENGHVVKFLTRTGLPARAAAHRVHGILGGQFLRDEDDVVAQTRLLLRDPEFRAPQAWDSAAAVATSSSSSHRRTRTVAANDAAIQRLVKRAGGLVLTGGLAPGSRSASESRALREKVIVPMWEDAKTVGAISRGVLALARTEFPGTNRSILEDMRVAAPRKRNEFAEHMLLRFFGAGGSVLSGGDAAVDGGTGNMNATAAQAEEKQEAAALTAGGGASTGSSGGGTFGDDCRYTVEQLGDALKWPARQIVQEPGYTFPWLNLHSGSDVRHARVVQDAHLLTAAGRKDAQLFAHRFVSLLHGSESPGVGVPRHHTQEACDDEVVMCLPLQIGSARVKHHFVVHRGDLYPGRLPSKGQANDVDVLYRSAHQALEAAGHVKQLEADVSADDV